LAKEDTARVSSKSRYHDTSQVRDAVLLVIPLLGG
jgi:hypothetical protein